MTKGKRNKMLLSLSIALTSFIAFNGNANAAVAAPRIAEQTSLEQGSEVKQARTSNEALQDWKNWVDDHAYSLNSIQPESFESKIASNKFEDLEMLKPLLHDKRIVFFRRKLAWCCRV